MINPKYDYSQIRTNKTKTNLSESDPEMEFNKFPKFILLETMEETPLNKLSPFRTENVISSRANSKSVKKIRNGNLWGLKGFLGSRWLRARLCCRKISDSIFWLFYFTPRWLAGAMPCPKKVQKKYTKRKDRNR